MSNYDRQALIEEANELGLEFKGNISNKKLAAMVAEFKGEPEPFDEPAAPPVAQKSEEPEPTAEDNVVTAAAEIARKRARERAKRRREGIAKRKEDAMRKQIVTITSRDTRESHVATTAFLSVQNQYFAIARAVPLDIPVELEHCLVRTAEEALMTHHTDEVVDGRRTGNKVTRRVKKYAISYGPEQ